MKCNAVRDNVELRKENQQLKEKLNAYAVSSDCGGGDRWWVVAVQILPLNRSFPFLLFLFLFILVLLFRNSFFCSLCIVPCSLFLVPCSLCIVLFFVLSSFFVLPSSINQQVRDKQTKWTLSILQREQEEEEYNADALFDDDDEDDDLVSEASLD